jgi:excisionase family DNA binding protein
MDRRAIEAMVMQHHANEPIEQHNDPRAFGLIKVAYSVNEALDLLSIGRTKFYELVSSGDLNITKLGRKSLVYAIDLAALLKKLRGCE